MPSSLGPGAFPGGFNLDPKFLQEAPPDRGQVLHKFGRITLQVWRYRKVPHYELLLDGKIIATERQIDTVMQTARRKLNRPKFGNSPSRKPGKQTIELFAYRGWRLVADTLTPIGFRTDDYNTWNGPVAKSDHNPATHEGSGLWAVKLTPSVIRDLMQQYHPEVHGIVQLGGVVVEHEIGYRAERATIRILRVEVPCSDKFLELLGDRYQCQVFRAQGGR